MHTVDSDQRIASLHSALPDIQEQVGDDMEPSHYALRRHLPYAPSLFVDSTLTSHELSGRRAASLVGLIKEYMFRYLGLNTTGFFDTAINEKTLWEQTIGLDTYSTDRELRTDLPHYWVYSQPFNSITLKHTQPNYVPFKSHAEALALHAKNQTQGLDSYMIGAGGGGIAERNYIQPQMFEPNLLHALYVVAHEPLHPLFKHLNHRDLEESLVTALSLSILQSFPEVEEWKGDTAFLRTPIQEYIADHTIKLQYFRLVGEKLHALYSRSERQGIPWRLQDENEFLALIRNDYIIYADSPFAVKESQNINNAWISALYPYTFALVVADFFRQKSIQPLQIIKSKSMRDLWIPRLRDFLIQPPIRTINGEELWQSVRQEFLAQPGKRSMI